jgi:hypothetical protein
MGSSLGCFGSSLGAVSSFGSALMGGGDADNDVFAIFRQVSIRVYVILLTCMHAFVH